MSNERVRSPLSRPLRVDEIKDGASGEINVGQAEMAAIAGLLDLVHLKDLSLAYRLCAGGGGRLRLTGTLKAGVTQTCVVSLEPVESSLDVTVEVEFWPASSIEQLEQSAEEPGGVTPLDWPEPISDGKIDLGPVIYETLATALDPYPKKEGVSFDWSQGEEGSGRTGASGPFAALARLKRG